MPASTTIRMSARPGSTQVSVAAGVASVTGAAYSAAGTSVKPAPGAVAIAGAAGAAKAIVQPKGGLVTVTAAAYLAGTNTPAIYGPGIIFDELANTTIGESTSNRWGYFRFRAEFSGALSVVVAYWQMGPGYGSGTGGTYDLLLYAADASGHPTGSALATQSIAASGSSNSARSFTFASPYSVTAGVVYCLVWHNTDTVGTNYGSLNCGFLRDAGAAYSSSRLAPKWLDTDFAHAYAANVTGPWTVRDDRLPIVDLTIGTSHQGNSYAEANYSSTSYVGKVNGASEMVREQFTPAASLTTSGGAIRVGKIAGTTADLRVSLRNASDVEVAYALIPAASIPDVAAPTGSGDYAGLGEAARMVDFDWVAGSVTTSAAQTYLRFSSSGGTFHLWVVRRLTTYHSACYFADGYAQKTTNGSTWSSLGNNANVNDLQFFLRRA